MAGVGQYGQGRRMSARNWKKILITTGAACGIASLAIPPAWAADGSPIRGNPIDTLPKLETPKAAAPTFTLSQPTQTQALQALLSRKITPMRFGIEGVHTLPFKEIAALFAPMAGHEVTIGDLVAKANEVTKMYQDAGYVLSFAFVPAQDFADGFVRVTVVEGYVQQTRFTGNPGNAEPELRRIARHIQDERPLKRATLERYLNLMTLMPGVKVKADLKPPTQTSGATDLTVDVTRQPISVGASASYGNPGIIGLFNVTANNLTPLGEQVQLSTIAPKGHNEQEYYAGVVTVPIGGDGLQAKIDASHYRGQPDDQVLTDAGLKRNIDQKRVGLTLSYPFLLNNQRSLTGSAGIYGVDNRDNYTLANGAPGNLTADVHVRVANVQLAYNEVKPKESRGVVLGIYKGINGLGANQETNDPGVLGPYDLGFTRYTITATQSFVLPWQFGIAAAVGGQYSPNTVPTPEQASFGGTRFGLAYPAGEIAGDSGWGASIELNRLFHVGWVYLKTVQPYIMADTARAYLNQGTLTHNRLGSVGLGVRVSDQKHYTLDMSLAKPVGDKPSNGDNRPLRFNANYSYQF